MASAVNWVCACTSFGVFISLVLLFCLMVVLFIYPRPSRVGRFVAGATDKTLAFVLRRVPGFYGRVQGYLTRRPCVQGDAEAGSYPAPVRRYYRLSDELGANYWRIGVLLVAMVVGGLFVLAFGNAMSAELRLLRCGVRILVMAVVMAGGLLVADQTYRQHQNSSNTGRGAFSDIGARDIPAELYRDFRRWFSMGYYLVALAGVVFMLLAIW